MVNLFSISPSPGVLITDAIEGCQLSKASLSFGRLDAFHPAVVVVAKKRMTHRGGAESAE
jgi:hypothetical protein